MTALDLTPNPSHPSCDTRGCDQKPQHWIRSPAGTYHRVCTDCRDELAAIAGWRPIY